MSISKPYLSEIRLKREAVESFDRYPFSLAAVRPLETLELHPAVTFFVGENGSGKSTLLEAIVVACGFNAEGGSRNFRFGTRNHTQTYFVSCGSPEDFLDLEMAFSSARKASSMSQQKSRSSMQNPVPDLRLARLTVSARCTSSHTESHSLLCS